MRLLHVTDFHFNKSWYAWLAENGAKYDACCFSGDLLDMFANAKTGLRPQIRWVRDWLATFPGRLFVCSGNHDFWPRPEHVIDNDACGGWLRKSARQSVSVDGFSEMLGKYRFTCCPWAGATIGTSLEPSVVLIHAPPAITTIASDGAGEAGALETSKIALALPAGSCVLSGHVHDPRRWHCRVGRSWSFNPGFDRSATEPNHIVLDLDRRTAEFFGWGRHLGPILLQ